MTSFLENIVLCHSNGQVLSHRLRILKSTRPEVVKSIVGATNFYDQATRRPLSDGSYFISNRVIVAEFPQQMSAKEFNERMDSYYNWIRQIKRKNVDAYHGLMKTGMIKDGEWVAFIDGVMIGRDKNKMRLYNNIDHTRKEHHGGVMFVVKVPEERGKLKQL